jgi:RNA polymerase sigma factor for flagellar operon FliA
MYELTEDRAKEGMKWVRGIAVGIAERCGYRGQIDDCIGAGSLGLTDAAARWDESRGVPFYPFACYRIRGEILDHMREQDPLSRDMRAYLKRVEKYIFKTQSYDVDKLDAQGVATACEMPLQHVEWALRYLTGCDSLHGGYRDLTDNSQDLRSSDPLRSEFVARLLDGLDARRRKIIIMYYVDELTMAEIGVRLGVNESRVSQIHKDIIAKLRSATERSGVTADDLREVTVPPMVGRNSWRSLSALEQAA